MRNFAKTFTKTFAAAALASAMGALVAPAAVRAEPETTLTADGLKYIDTKPGAGAVAKTGQTVKVHYTGWLYVNGAKGKKFDSSRDRGEPFEFALGGGQVIKGWDEGVENMKVGGKRTLIIPPELGYGARAMGNAIPANSWLIFDVELVGVK